MSAVDFSGPAPVVIRKVRHDARTTGLVELQKEASISPETVKAEIAETEVVPPGGVNPVPGKKGKKKLRKVEALLAPRKDDGPLAPVPDPTAKPYKAPKRKKAKKAVKLSKDWAKWNQEHAAAAATHGRAVLQRRR